MAGTWNALQNQPGFNASTMLLLTDGTVMCQDDAQAQWYKFTPDQFGSYIAGTWSKMSAMNISRKFFASQILNDGSVLVVGGEYSSAGSNTNTAELYDPVRNRWTTVTAGFSWVNGDAPSCMLADGRILYGSISTNQSAIYDPVAKTWVEAGTAFGTKSATKRAANSDEETWVLLPDGTVLTVECANIGAAEKYVPSQDEWVSASAGALPVTLVDAGNSEIGPAILLTDGRVFFIGATGHTAFYTPPARDPSQPGTWTAGPDILDNHNNLSTVIDGPACLLPNGKVLLVAGLRHLERTNFWSGPDVFFEFDPTSNAITELTGSHQPTIPNNIPYNNTWNARLLLLPTGQVMFSSATEHVEIYNPDGTWEPAWQPTILNRMDLTALSVVRPYWVMGRQLNGLSQAVSYGDDYTAATNYPLVRLAFNISGHLYYCRTSGFSSMGVATGTAITRFRFDIPWNIERGGAVLVISVNGIPADMIPTLVIPRIPHIPYLILRIPKRIIAKAKVMTTKPKPVTIISFVIIAVIAIGAIIRRYSKGRTSIG